MGVVFTRFLGLVGGLSKRQRKEMQQFFSLVSEKAKGWCVFRFLRRGAEFDLFADLHPNFADNVASVSHDSQDVHGGWRRLFHW